MKLVWENSIPQKPVIGACGNIYTHGELMESFVAAFKEKSWEFHLEALWAPPELRPPSFTAGCGGARTSLDDGRLPPVTPLPTRGPAFPSACPALSSAPQGPHSLSRGISCPLRWRPNPQTRAWAGPAAPEASPWLQMARPPGALLWPSPCVCPRLLCSQRHHHGGIGAPCSGATSHLQGAHVHRRPHAGCCGCVNLRGSHSAHDIRRKGTRGSVRHWVS